MKSRLLLFFCFVFAVGIFKPTEAKPVLCFILPVLCNKPTTTTITYPTTTPTSTTSTTTTTTTETTTTTTTSTSSTTSESTTTTTQAPPPPTPTFQQIIDGLELIPPGPKPKQEESYITTCDFGGCDKEEDEGECEEGFCSIADLDFSFDGNYNFDYEGLQLFENFESFDSFDLGDKLSALLTLDYLSSTSSGLDCF